MNKAEPIRQRFQGGDLVKKKDTDLDFKNIYIVWNVSGFRDSVIYKLRHIRGFGMHDLTERQAEGYERVIQQKDGSIALADEAMETKDA